MYKLTTYWKHIMTAPLFSAEENVTCARKILLFLLTSFWHHRRRYYPSIIDSVQEPFNRKMIIAILDILTIQQSSNSYRHTMSWESMYNASVGKKTVLLFARSFAHTAHSFASLCITYFACALCCDHFRIWSFTRALSSAISQSRSISRSLALSIPTATRTRYRVFLKKVLHNRDEKMQEKLKMTKQKDTNLVQVQQ